MENISNISLVEHEAYQKFSVLYDDQNPPPEMDRAINLRDSGLIFIGKIITIIAGILLAGFRTAEQFYLAASFSGNVWLSRSEAFLAVLAVEGTILFLSADKARKRGEIHTWVATAGILLAVGISLLAGLGQSIRLIDGLSVEWLNRFTTATAIGLSLASIVAWIGGEILGQEMAFVYIANENNRRKYEKAYAHWLDKKNAVWARSKTKRMVLEGATSSAGRTDTRTTTSDWRLLSHDDKLKVALLTPEKIQKQYLVSRRTAYTWMSDAKKYAEEYIYNEE